MSLVQTRTRRRIGPRSAGISMTPDEFDSARFVPHYRYELIQGVLVVAPPPDPTERGPNDDLGSMLRVYQRTHPQGSSLNDTLPEQTLNTTPQRRRCDRAIWAGLVRMPEPDQDIPAIVVEFVSESRRDILRDYETKRDEYRRLGVRDYWVIDRFRRVMVVYRFRMDSDSTEEIVVRESAIYQTDVLPGFELPLSRLLGVADRYPKKNRNRRPGAGGSR